MTASPAVDPFNLRALIRTVAATSDSADPKVLAREVLSLIPDSHLRDVLAQTLGDYVRVLLHRGTATPDEEGKPDGQAASWKLQGARAYGRLLRQAVDVTGDGTGWKHLGECTAADLSSVAELRRQEAERLIATAGWYEKIARLLDEYDAATVAALPEPVLTTLATEGP